MGSASLCPDGTYTTPSQRALQRKITSPKVPKEVAIKPPPPHQNSPQTSVQEETKGTMELQDWSPIRITGTLLSDARLQL